MLRMCLNPKVLAGLAGIGLAIYLIAPNLIVAALPLLILAACPLSMLLMGGAMMRGHEQTEAVAGKDRAAAVVDSSQPLRSAEEVSALRAEVRDLSDRQAALLEEMRRLQQPGQAETPVKALEEAEEIARSTSRD